MLPIPEKEPKGSDAEGWVWTSPWEAEKLLLLLAEPIPGILGEGGAASDCHHDCADVVWSSSGTSIVSASKELVLKV